jgi:hypothetical protein
MNQNVITKQSEQFQNQTDQNVRTEESLSETDAMVNIDTMPLPITKFWINASFLFVGSPTK